MTPNLSIWEEMKNFILEGHCPTKHRVWQEATLPPLPPHEE